jgi:hypothetical protein
MGRQPGLDGIRTFSVGLIILHHAEIVQMTVDPQHRELITGGFVEPPCQSPFETPLAGVPPLPERLDDDRTRHVADLMREVAAADPEHVFFIENADAWCTDPAVSENPEYRYDGVHVLGPGAALIMDTIAGALLAIPE